MTPAAIPGVAISRQQQLEALFEGQPSLEAVWLFGSRALGRYREGSDIDLCLVGEGFTHRDHVRLMAAIDELLMPWQVDLVLKQDMPPDLLAHVKSVGFCIWRRL